MHSLNTLLGTVYLCWVDLPALVLNSSWHKLHKEIRNMMASCIVLKMFHVQFRAMKFTPCMVLYWILIMDLDLGGHWRILNSLSGLWNQFEISFAEVAVRRWRICFHDSCFLCDDYVKKKTLTITPPLTARGVPTM